MSSKMLYIFILGYLPVQVSPDVEEKGGLSPPLSPPPIYLPTDSIKQDFLTISSHSGTFC